MALGAGRILILGVVFITGFSPEVQVPSAHRAIAGSDTLIPCTFSSHKLPADPKFLVVSWYFEGSKILTYDDQVWTRDPRFFLDTARAINGDASLSINRVTISDDGIYKCSISYNAERMEKEVTFFVHAPPKITITKRIVVMNNESILSSSITGFYPARIDIKWFKEERILNNLNVFRPSRNPDGTYSVTSSVTIIPTEKDKNQSFSCRVQHESLSGALRKDFQLEYGAIPTIEIVSSEFSLNMEQALVCQVYGFDPHSVVVEWFLNGSFVEMTKTRRINISAVESIYHFTPTQQNWGMELSCEVQHETLSVPLVKKLLVEGKVVAIKHRIWMYVSLCVVSLLCVIIYCIYQKKAGEEEEVDTCDGPVQENAHSMGLNFGLFVLMRFVLLCPMFPPFLTLVNLKEFLAQLGMEDNLELKLTLKDILNILVPNLINMKPQNIQDVPLHYLRKLSALNKTSRNTTCQRVQCNLSKDNDKMNSLHPLDVVCALLHCSDHFLQQEIVSKMSMYQFAVPLLLPAGEGTDCTLMLWAMRDIVKRWRPHSLADSKGFMEDNVVNVPLPTFSFVRLGKSKLSKSKILNQVLSRDQQHQDLFIHDNMEGGKIQRKISNGLVEMSWNFPSGSKSSDIFPEPIAVTNLRGDLESNWDQFRFLTRVSSAVFIFTERISERELRMLSTCDTSDTLYYVIISPNPGEEVSQENIQNLQKYMKIEENNIVLKSRTDNDTILAGKIKTLINSFLENSPNKVIFHDRVKTPGELAVRVDEDTEACRNAREYAGNITKEIKDVAQYKKETMCLQGDLWKQVSEIEKEMCRMKNQGGKDAQEYQSDLKSKLMSLREKQYVHGLSPGIKLFIDAFITLSQSEKHYFLKWMKLDLDSIARRSLFDLQTEYKEKSKEKIKNKEELKQLDQKISDSSLGIEHFLREMGQFYEAECSMFSKEIIQEEQRQYTRLPGMAADLLLDGFPLELIDGDASNIPMRWITEVLTDLDTKTGGRYRMRVISVLGVQGTGKSTLLNTMFGLQFPVTCGRCTRGAFMTLIRVSEDFIEELGCDFILVIDTEGLKAPELASLEDSNERDNELVTLVVRLSDITIVNMDMEHTGEMEDILNTVVHSFLKMKDMPNKKLKCQFVYQKVTDLSAEDKIMRHKNKFQEELDKMTQIAADVEKKQGISKFSDVVDFSDDQDHWYVPTMWNGVPPMASISIEYSEKISELKTHLIEIMKQHKQINEPRTIKEFISWIKRLCDIVKHENQIFSFSTSGGQSL